MMSNEKSILLVEDDPDIREVLQQLLEMEGYKVITAVNGKEALTIMEGEAHPSVILLDLFMPVMNGAQFLEAIHRERKEVMDQTPVIVLSAAPPQGDLVKAVISKAAEFIKKPVDLDHFLKVVSGYCPVS